MTPTERKEPERSRIPRLRHQAGDSTTVSKSGRAISGFGDYLPDCFPSAVANAADPQGGQVEERGRRRKGPRLEPSSDLSASADPSSRPMQRTPSAPPFACEPGTACMTSVAAEPGPRREAGCARIAAVTRSASGSWDEASERRGHALEGKAEGGDTAAVHGDGGLVCAQARRFVEGGEHLDLKWMLAEAVVLERPALCGADAEEAGVLTGAVVLEPAAVRGPPRGRPPSLRRAQGSRTAASCSARMVQAEAMATSSSSEVVAERTREAPGSAWRPSA